jgi:hypothetical protein
VPRELAGNENLKRKRRLLVRDWFFYVVWYVRLRKIVKNLITEEEVGRRERDSDSRYAEIMQLVDGMSPGEQLRELKDKIKMCSKETSGLASMNIVKHFSMKVPKIVINLMSEDFNNHQFEIEL